MTTTTILTTRDGKMLKRTGTSGLTVTGTRTGDNVAVEMEFDVATPEEGHAMIGSFLVQLEELLGENFIAQCLAHYGEETGKVIKRDGERDIVWIKGRSGKGKK